MAAKKTIRQMLEAGEFIWAPCIYDCVSARVVEMCGYNACLISSCELEFAMNGIPAGLYNWEEYIWATERIANSTTLPVIVDGENGGGTPMQVYRNCKRLAEAGAMAISIEDTLSGAVNVDYFYGRSRGYMDRELWATNVHAAVEAVKGTDCMIIARTDCKGGGAAQIGAIGENPFCLGLDEAILRAKMGVEAGAEITMIQNICHAGCEEECGRIVAEVPGYRFYPDVHATDGAPDLTLEQMQEMGFHLVSNHAAMKGATKGMMEYFRENFKNKNTVYSENDEFYNMGHVFTPFKMEDWIERDKSYEAYEKELREKSMAGR
jgi:2-methylisocitrate lyase-like PEP mutase family enzyme